MSSSDTHEHPVVASERRWREVIHGLLIMAWVMACIGSVITALAMGSVPLAILALALIAGLAHMDRRQRQAL